MAQAAQRQQVDIDWISFIDAARWLAAARDEESLPVGACTPLLQETSPSSTRCNTSSSGWGASPWTTPNRPWRCLTGVDSSSQRSPEFGLRSAAGRSNWKPTGGEEGDKVCFRRGEYLAIGIHVPL